MQVVRAPHLRKTMSTKNITLENAESALPSHPENAMVYHHVSYPIPKEIEEHIQDDSSMMFSAYVPHIFQLSSIFLGVAIFQVVILPYINSNIFHIIVSLQ